MFKILKKGHCFNPSDIGVKDILIGCGKIIRISDDIKPEGLFEYDLVDCTGKLVFPGFIDQHIHIIGGGGEDGSDSRIPEISLGDITTAGVSTIVGLLGFDDITRSVITLLLKARALEKEGLSTFIYTGSYSIPAQTVTGHISSDIALIDKVLGVGEIAISDYRSSHFGLQTFKEIAAEVLKGGLIGKKAGVVHLHIGEGKEGLTPLFSLLEETEYPIGMFVPSHLNRNKRLFEQALMYGSRGGNIDITAGEDEGGGYGVRKAMKAVFESGINPGLLTVSSDGNGSIPGINGSKDGVGKVKSLFDDIAGCLLDRELQIPMVAACVTENVARLLKIYPEKGVLKQGSDADVLVLNREDMGIFRLFIGGEVYVKDGTAVKKGRFEE